MASSTLLKIFQKHKQFLNIPLRSLIFAIFSWLDFELEGLHLTLMVSIFAVRMTEIFSRFSRILQNSSKFFKRFIGTQIDTVKFFRPYAVK